eukprot:gene19364-biopygen24183
MLPAISRLVERTIAVQLKTHVAQNHVLPCCQHGFRARHNTTTTLVQLIDAVATGLDDDEGGVAMVASADLAGAFDTLDRTILVDKLKKTCGVTGAAADLIESYLEDLDDAITNADVFQYCDDVSLVVVAKTQEDARLKMNKALQEFTDYANGNRLAAEPTKSQVMVCTTRGRAKTQVIRLSWEEHNSNAAGKASGIARSVARGTKFLKTSDRAGLIRALAHPHLDYCQPALAKPSAAAFNSLQRAYNRTARIAAKTQRSEPARKRLDWPTWQERSEAASEQLVGGWVRCDV